MKSIPLIKKANPEADYKLSIWFEDGVNGVVDLSDLRGKGVFSYWKDQETFSAFHIDQWGKLSWNEDLDIDPDGLYLELIGKTFEEYANS